MTEQEIDQLSTPEERRAEDLYKSLQREAIANGGMMGETALLELSQTVSILVERNERLGLYKPSGGSSSSASCTSERTPPRADGASS